MRVVIALGGNALQRRGEAADLDRQRRNLEVAAAILAGQAGTCVTQPPFSPS